MVIVLVGIINCKPTLNPSHFQDPRSSMRCIYLRIYLCVTQFTNVKYAHHSHNIIVMLGLKMGGEFMKSGNFLTPEDSLLYMEL